MKLPVNKGVLVRVIISKMNYIISTYNLKPITEKKITKSLSAKTSYFLFVCFIQQEDSKKTFFWKINKTMTTMKTPSDVCSISRSSKSHPIFFVIFLISHFRCDSLVEIFFIINFAILPVFRMNEALPKKILNNQNCKGKNFLSNFHN